ncbi:hypothetical protein BB8028_0002g02670 [Beauveria bassiana]|uniref:Wax synthase domain-containing protein n=1 Tax=Beauveria bassiana TaxID=176275 RepID=A0A2S7Y1Z1_BEABA|nr:hypothetical protein BB8028_0002g02670 [Beauveria bassiana]
MDSISALLLSPLALVAILVGPCWLRHNLIFRCFAVFVTVVLSWNTVCFTRQVNMVIDYVTGILSAWYIIWATSIMFCQGSIACRRHCQCSRFTDKVSKSLKEPTMNCSDIPARFSWDRLFWTLDLVTNFRLVGMDWHDGPRPKQNVGERNQSAGKLTFAIKHVLKLIGGYLWINLSYEMLFKEANDAFSKQNLVSRCRILQYLGCLSVLGTSMTMLHSSLALLWLIHQPLGLSENGLTFPPLWGPRSSILRSGLQGFWGEFWQDLFRIGLLSCGKAVLPAKYRNQPAAYIFPVFLLSGIMHTAGTLAVTGCTWAIGRTMAFFVLQPFGIIVQKLIIAALQQLSIIKYPRGTGKSVVQLMYMAVWARLTLPLLLDDLLLAGIMNDFLAPWSVFGCIYRTIYPN